MVIVTWCTVSRKVFSRVASVVDVGDEMSPHLLSALQQNVHSVIVPNEVR
jgi:hypothetical protein